MEILFPPALYCICCGKIVDRSRSYSLCDHCMTHIRWNAEEPEEKDGIRILACTAYGIYERSIIFGLKYSGHRYIARSVAEMMRDILAVTEGLNETELLLVPVPLSARKERERGFNQAALIAKHLSVLTGIPLENKVLLRTRETVPMRGLSPTQRQLNAHNAFALAPGREDFAAGKTVLLIDDFYTTGATASACTEALQAAGAQDICLLAFARRAFAPANPVQGSVASVV